ncbi:GNAT family N-acetyltransferase [Clostridium sp.]|uniref:GNAT family N-acetyltransferase n=1 Tax=Clostridium sp. TaxID=1506 RepID=UPI003F3FE285
MEKVKFRKVQEEDIEALRKIYMYYVENSTATFHIGDISYNEMKDILFSQDELYESFVIYDDEIIGYVLLAPYKKREAYRRSAEVTIYLKAGINKNGIGTRAINFVEEVAKKKGIKTLLAIICGENIASIKLFEKNNYIKCGHLKNVGEKFNRVLDIVTYQKEI